MSYDEIDEGTPLTTITVHVNANISMEWASLVTCNDTSLYFTNSLLPGNLKGQFFAGFSGVTLEDWQIFYLTLILIRTLQQPYITHKCNGQLQEAECTIIHTRQ